MGAIPENVANYTYFYFSVYVASAFVITLLALMLFYVACSKKFRLNWYEKNLLERNNEIIKTAYSNSDTSSVQSIYPSVEDLSDIYPSTSHHIGPLIGTSNIPVTIAEEIIPNIKVHNYSTYPKPPLSDSSSSPQTDLDKAFIFNSPTKTRPVTMQSKLDPTKINTSLYQKTIKGQQPLEIKSAGIIHLIVSYDVTAGMLNIKILEVNDLSTTEFNGTANPYAKIRLLPHHANVWQTRVHKRTLNPVFDEDFVFEVDPQEISKHTLEVTLCDFVAYSRHRNIGTIRLQLSTIDLHQVTDVWKELKACTEREVKADLGDLMVAFSYLPSAERLTVTIIKARNLKIVDETRTSSDPFVKVAILVDGKRIKKHKTSFHRNTTSPVFNEALIFKIGKDVLKRCCIEFRVFHDSLLGGSELIGICIIGSNAICRFHERQIHSELVHDQLVAPQWLPLTDSYTH